MPKLVLLVVANVPNIPVVAFIVLTEVILPAIKFKFDVLNDGINCCVLILEL